MKNLIATVAASVILASCTAMSGSKVGTAQENIVGTQWKLADNVKGKTPTLVIESGKISGNGGCNNYFGEVNIDQTAGNFKVGSLGSTKMMCDNMATEQNYFSALNETNKYVVTGSSLELYKDKLLLLKFNKMP